MTPGSTGKGPRRFFVRSPEPLPKGVGSTLRMLRAPATGEAMSELILDGAAHRVDLAPFAPGRLPPLDPAPGVAGWANAPAPGVDRNADGAALLPTRISHRRTAWAKSPGAVARCVTA